VAARFPVVTGLGIVSPAGRSTDEIWRSFATQTSGLSPLTLFPSPRYGQVLVGEVHYDLTALGAPVRGSRSDRLGWLAARDAIQSAGLSSEFFGDRAGVILGSSVGGSFDSERFLTALIKRGQMRARPVRFHECISTVDLIADSFGLYGPGTAISTACSSGALAIAMAAEMIQSGEADIMLAGGADSLSHITWGGFHSLLLVDSAGCRPFDARRAGMSLGEGAAILLLETEASARARGATILARVAGWGASCDAHHVTAPHPEGAGAADAMRTALARAGLEPGAIDYVNAHGTGTRDNDLAEARALRTVFGDRVPPVSSTKRFFGHALAASGAIEALVCVETLRRQATPPNLGFATPDPALGMSPVTALQSASLTHVMSNSFGFGGNNAVLIFSRPDAPARTRSPSAIPVAVTGLGAIGPGTLADRAIEPPLPAGTVKAHSCGALAEAATLSPNQRRRLSRLVQMAVLAARRSHSPTPSERLAVSIGTGLGCLEDAGAFVENLIAKDEAEPMPSRFPGSVHNAPAGQVAIDLGARGLNSAPTAGEVSFENALWLGMRALTNGEVDCALAGAVDELNKYPLAIGRRWGIWTETTRPGEGAVVTSLRRSENAGAPLARLVAVRLGRYRRPFDAEREADWIASAVDLAAVDLVVSGAGGWPALDPLYKAVLASLSARAGRKLEHLTYKSRCGEFYAASAFGFSVAVDQVRNSRRGALLYTLGMRGAKALCFLQP
jgi:3-oxoacyl-[acyl-carrier-protein] synthase-1/3-oxoacyl-[acyl-carrier-protein] synthase II